MTIFDQAKEAVRETIFGQLGVAAEYRPVAGAPVPLQVMFKPLGRTDSDYGDSFRASINVMRDDVDGRPEDGDVFFIETESPPLWRVTVEAEGETEGQTRFTWSVLCVGQEGRRLKPGRLERV